jgi:hypothetical protein
MFKMVLDMESGWFFTAPLRLLRAAVQYSRFAWLSGAGLTRQFMDLRSAGGRLLWLMTLPGGWGLWLRDCAQFPLP